MKEIKMIKNFLLLTFIFLQFQAIANDDWSLKRDKKDIKIYTKTEDGEKLKHSKANMIVAASKERVIDIIKDVPNYVNWVPKTKSAKTLKAFSDSHSFYYTEIKSSIISNRDLILEIFVTHDGDTTFIDMTGKPEYIDEKDHLVRMPRYKGLYTIVKLADGKTEITLEYIVDPGGLIPAWMANTVSVDMPHDTFVNLKEEIEKE